MKTGRDDHTWVVFNSNLGGALACMRCGRSYLPNYPAPVDIITAISKAFEEIHATCELRAEGEACPYCMRWGHAPDACERKR
jgi:hypothetical protein